MRERAGGEENARVWVIERKREEERERDRKERGSSTYYIRIAFYHQYLFHLRIGINLCIGHICLGGKRIRNYDSVRVVQLCESQREFQCTMSR